MKINRILCPVDFSNFNKEANDIASRLAEISGASVVYLHVAQVGLYDDSYDYALQRMAEKKLQEMEEFVPTRSKIRYSYDVKFGSVPTRIVEHAKDKDCDLIVMSTHGRTGLRRTLLGSVAEKVVRNAHCAVMTLRPGTRYFVDNDQAQPSTETSERVS